MEFTHEQISEIISEITNGESGFHGLVKRGLESLMLTERSLHNETLSDVSNGFEAVESAMEVRSSSFGSRVVVTVIFTRCY